METKMFGEQKIHANQTVFSYHFYKNLILPFKVFVLSKNMYLDALYDEKDLLKTMMGTVYEWKRPS